MPALSLFSPVKQIASFTIMSVGKLDNTKVASASAPSRWLWLAIGSAWLLALLTFSLPGREGPESLAGLDAVALAKVGGRAGVILAAVWAIAHFWHHPRRRLVGGALLPLLLFLAWAVLSVSWSPLKTVSLGQSASLTAQLVMAALLGLLASRPDDHLRVIFQLNALLLAISSTVLTLHLLMPHVSGLSRDLAGDGGIGLVHPTSAGATASLGIVLLLLTRLIWKPAWSQRLLFPSLTVYTGLLFFAASRTAMAMTAVLLAAGLLILLHRAALAAAALGACTLGAIYLCVDPGLGLVESTLGSSSHYLMRNESMESVKSLTGRRELWEEVWTEFYGSPLIGCGYFVTSQDGSLDAWGTPGNRTAHNLFLQVLSSTGVVGMALFLWGMGRIAIRAARDLPASSQGRRLGVFLLLIGMWYVGWGQLCSSFMGPIQPESIVFFCCLGLALSGLRIGSGGVASANRHHGFVPTGART